MNLGEKIKFIRKERGMTQAQLVGDRITRSMLSEIEKGKALPSLDTLHYLASELGVSAAYLLDESEDITAYRKRREMPTLMKLYREGDYAACFRHGEALQGEGDDELSLLLAHCASAEGKRAFRAGNMETALVYFQEAAAYAEKTVYPTADIAATTSLYRAIAENVSSPRRDFDEAAYRQHVNTATDAELFSYMTDNPDYPYENSLFSAHIEARLLLREKRYRAALPLLLAIEERKTETGVTAYFLFRLYSDLELCYREEQNFERAYKYATKRITLLSAFQS